MHIDHLAIDVTRAGWSSIPASTRSSDHGNSAQQKNGRDGGACPPPRPNFVATRHAFRRRDCELIDHDIELLTSLKLWLTCWPTDLTSVAETAMIKANSTPYSTAVGPSSLSKNRFTFKTRSFIAKLLFWAID
jgi:hypothetical protein